MENNGINFIETVKHEAKILNSLFRETTTAVDDLWEFMDVNDWFGVEHTGTGKNICIPTFEPLKERIDLWLRAYGKSRGEKIDLMLETYSAIYPNSCFLFRNFIKKTDCKEKNSTWKLLDFLLATLKDEITHYDESQIKSLVMQANQELSLVGMRQLVDFLNTFNEKNWYYEFQSRQVIKLEISAYSIEQFSIMAYIIFNEEAWKKHDLIKKAAEKRKYADLWLFSALHFLGAVRRTDITRLPVPSLPYSPTEIRERILRGTFLGAEARAISEEFLFRLEMKSLKPNKTKRSNNVPNVKLSIAKTVLEPMGIILALSLSWRQPGDSFVSTDIDLIDIRSFFGEEFIRALGYKNFSSRRANKSYMQGIETVTDKNAGAKSKGYILSALARSHKGGIGKLPKITDVYLKDAKFSGYKPEFILREMFERGIFGFIPALLLEKYIGKDYLRLDVTSQTKLIKELGLNAFQLENIVSCAVKSFRHARNVVEALLYKQSDELSSEHCRLGKILQNIAAEAAPSKQTEFLCLWTASGGMCKYSHRASCLGCEYEIYTKSAVHLLMKEYVKLNRKLEDADSFTQIRLKNILEKGIMPAIAEIMASIPMLYPNSAMEPIYAIVERGIFDASHPSE